MMKEWYKEWFNTPEYLNVYKHRNNEDALELAALIMDVLKPSADSLVLDMACGAGRHSLIFAEKGMQVTAVDISENLLSVAKESAEKLNYHIDFVNADLRHFYLEKKFDLALNLFTSFGYFETDEENFKVFEQAYDHLKVGGKFVFDYFNSSFLMDNLVEESTEKFNGVELLQRRNIKNKRVEKKIIIRKDGQEHQYLESVRMYKFKELISALQQCGFKIIKTCGDFEGNFFNEDESSRLIIFAER